jgi:hypothetical protein
MNNTERQCIINSLDLILTSHSDVITDSFARIIKLLGREHPAANNITSSGMERAATSLEEMAARCLRVAAEIRTLKVT